MGRPASPPFFYLSLARPRLKCSANGKGKGERPPIFILPHEGEPEANVK